MAAGFAALGDFLDDALELPVTGLDKVERTYRIEGPSALDGVRIERVTTLAARLAAGGSAVDAPALDDEQEIDLYRMCLGSAYDQLLADVSWAAFRHVALTSMMWITADRETAEAYWATGNAPGKAPSRAERRSATRASSAKGAASTTKPRASTSGTRAVSPRSRKAAPAQP
ncbi:hypothetical protein SFUL_5509 [Streptomyces microflavus DSM 40593]|uniref:DUF7426 domain-containing protein n=1 Tax=Streptomyces microflavus DSM 40593 TaxID=1303692 RepID=N0D4Z5_STRMI|nr:hypothetical protein [Streptomyces microflavus]AGK80397.1 hypothetical protein SFUL_5509 [Streptomyces microflavus DSM 40593]